MQNTYSDEMNVILNQISIRNADCIKGHIYLPEQIGRADIRWNSSHPEIISTETVGLMKPGLVSRTAQDVEVVLTALVTLGQETASKEVTVCVKKAPATLTDDDFGGYLFAHFIGEETEDSEQIYFAVSEKGLHFKDLNHCQPVLKSELGEKGVRDPYLYRSVEGDRFFLIATDLSIYHRGGWSLNEQGYYDPSTTGSNFLVLWESEDLIHWADPVLVPAAPENAGMAWAPEMIYCEELAEYLIFFSSSIMNPETKYKAKPNAIYAVTTRDFVHFSETRLFLDCQSDQEPDGKQREIIDSTIIKIGSYYYCASKDGDNAEANGGIRIHRSTSLLHPEQWETVLNLTDLGLDISELDVKALDNGDLEGPELFRFNKRDWENPQIPEYAIMMDRYAAGSGYLPIKTTDIEDTDNHKQSWKLLDKTEYSFDRLKKRHGTVMPITLEEVTRLKQAFGE